MILKLRYAILWVGAFFVIVVMNGLIIQKEILVANGQVIFLELAPRDPRSLIQGDYMALNYAIAREINFVASADGSLVVKVDEKNIAHFVRLHTAQTALAADELLLNYRNRVGEFHLGAESFFFQEGQANDYATARYAELRVADSGESVLIGLRGPKLELLGPLPNESP